MITSKFSSVGTVVAALTLLSAAAKAEEDTTTKPDAGEVHSRVVARIGVPNADKAEMEQLMAERQKQIAEANSAKLLEMTQRGAYEATMVEPEQAATESSLAERMTQSPSKALKNSAIGRHMASDPDFERAARMRSGEIPRYADVKASILKAEQLGILSHEEAQEARNEMWDEDVQNHQSYWVDFSNPEVPKSGNILAPALLLAEPVIDQVQ